MMVIKFRSSEEHGDLLKKVKKMKKFTDELEDMLESCEEEVDFRGGSYRRHYDDEDMRAEGRYGYRRGGM
jgi:hypothetical protein